MIVRIFWLLFQLYITYIYILLASERSRDNTIENRGCSYVYIYVWTYVCLFVL